GFQNAREANVVARRGHAFRRRGKRFAFPEDRRTRPAQRSKAKVGALHLRNIAHAQIGTALRGDLELQALGAGRLDRQAYAHFLAVGLLFAEELVLVDLSLRKLGLAQRHRSRLSCKAETVAVEVVAVGYSIANFHGPRIESTGGKTERLVRLEQIVGPRRARRRQRSQQQQQGEQKSVHELSR